MKSRLGRQMVDIWRSHRPDLDGQSYISQIQMVDFNEN
jgi:hypothetical protein